MASCAAIAATPQDPPKNQSNHDIDPMNLYGLHPDIARQLRTFDGGLLKSQVNNGEEFPPYLCDSGEVTPEFSLLTVVRFDEQPLEGTTGLRGSSPAGTRVGTTSDCSPPPATS
jgi:prostaglandin-endoperoxide synthase 2